MKKHIALFLALALVFCCAACSNAPADASPSPSEEVSPLPVETVSPSPESEDASPSPSATQDVEESPQVSSSPLTISLPDSFVQEEYEGASCYYISDDALFLAMEEPFDTLESAGLTSNSPLEEYAQAVISINGVDSQVGTDAKGNVYFTYDETVSGYDYSYYAVVKKGTSSFWLCQFACLAEDADSMFGSFAEWGSTIIVP